MKKSGQAMIEFALVIPLLAVMLFAIIQYGFIFAAYITVRNASALGARQSVIYKASAADAEAVAKGALAPMLNPDLATATAGTTNINGKTTQTMTVTYNLPLIIPFVVPGGGSTRTVTATTIMR